MYKRQLLIREAGRIFPGRLEALDAWVPPWRAPADPSGGVRADAGRRGAALLPAHPATCDAVADLLGCAEGWASPGDPSVATPPGVGLLTAHPATCDAVATLLGCDGEWAARADGAPSAGSVLTRRHPDASVALEALLTGG